MRKSRPDGRFFHVAKNEEIAPLIADRNGAAAQD
jgi:hypothetical protein